MNKNLVNKRILTAIQIFVVIASFMYLGIKFYNEGSDLLRLDLEIDGLKLLIVAFLLMPVNWFVEALKWRSLMEQFKPVSMSTAINSVVTGLPYGMITPWRVGEWYGRAEQIGESFKGSILGGVGGIIQQSVTIVFGLLGMSVWFEWEKHNLILWGLGSVVFLFLEYYLLKVIGKKIDAFRYLSALERISYLKAMFWAIVRYIIFASQYVLLLKMMGIERGVEELYAGVAIIYLGLYVLPLTNLADLSIRSVFAVSLFSGETVLNAVSPGILIWFINLWIPTLIGSFWLMRKVVKQNV